MNSQSNSSRRHQKFKRIRACFLTLVFLTSTISDNAVSANPELVTVSVKTGPTRVDVFKPTLSLTEQSSDEQIATARIFREPLTPCSSRNSSSLENQELVAALTSFRDGANLEDLSALDRFIEKYPNSRWQPALELNMGKLSFESGYFSKALERFKSAWEGAQNETGTPAETLASDSLSEYLLLNARLGRKDEVEKYLLIAKGRVFRGASEERLEGARQGLATMVGRPECAFKCGPFALNKILDVTNADPTRDVIEKAASTTKGTNLAQLKTWSKQCGLNYQIAQRTPGAPLVIPSIIHWKVDHFAALTDAHNDRYHVQDSTFGQQGNFWLSQQAIDDQSDGYFLVPSGSLPPGWRAVTEAEGAKIWGKGAGHLRNYGDGQRGPNDQCTLGPCVCPGMPSASAWSMMATLHIVDTPITYSPPIGPEMNFTLNYTHLEPNQPANPAFPCFGPDWNFNWVSYLSVDASKNVIVRLGTGGSQVYNFTQPNNLTNPYAPDLLSQAVLTISSKDSYELKLPDGSASVYNQPDGTGRFFMTKFVDAQGNATTITYDANFRITAITDAQGQVSTLTYASNTVGNLGYYLITRITDPFARQANFEYDGANKHVSSISDVLGMRSKFIYDPNSSFIMSMTTPYGTSSFYAYTPPKAAEGMNKDEARGLRMVFPDGTSSVIENWAGPPLQTYFWDRHAVQLYPGDAEACIYTHCKTTTWMASDDTVYERAVPKSIKMPLESEVVYSYEGERPFGTSSLRIVGLSNKPIEIKRLLDNNNQQTSTFEYNRTGNITKSIDPIGRTMSYFYSADGIDLLEVRETKGGNNFLIGKWQYDNKHLPTTYIDGSGRKTQYTYRSDGQPQTSTDANNNVTTYGYTGNYLTSINGPLNGSADRTDFSYDAYNRLWTITNSQGYQVKYEYDLLNRPTRTIYPDSTFEELRYNRLEPVLSIDRLGRVTESQFDSIGQLRKTIDPAGRTTEFQWCSCGSLVSLKDGAENKTNWQHDLQGRTVAKVYADGSVVNYEYENRTSRLKRRIDAMNQITNYSYFDDDSLSSITYDNDGDQTSDVGLTWDTNYRRIKTVSNNWGRLNYVHKDYITDAFGAPTTGGGMLQKIEHYLNPGFVHDTTRDITYNYDNLGRTTNRSINGNNNSATWTYDAINRVISETNALGAFDYSYVDQNTTSGVGDRGSSQLFQILYPNGQRTKFQYHQNLHDQRLSGITNIAASGQLLSMFNYDYDVTGQITRWRQVQKGVDLNYKMNYDNAGQLLSARASEGQPLQPYSREFDYSYDKAGNRTSVQESHVQTLHLTGEISSGDVLSLILSNNQLVGGQTSLSYTVQPSDKSATIMSALATSVNKDPSLKAIGISANSFLNTLTIRSLGPHQTTCFVSANPGATEQLVFGPSGDGTVNAVIKGTKTTNDIVRLKFIDYGLPAGEEIISYTVQASDTLTTIATALADAINANNNLRHAGITADATTGTNINLKSISPNLTRYDESTASGSGGAGSEKISLSVNVNPVRTMNLIGRRPTGSTVSISVFDSSLPAGFENVNYIIQSGDTIANIVSGLASSINSNSNLDALKIKAQANGEKAHLRSASPTLTSYVNTSSEDVLSFTTFDTNPNPIQIFSVEGDSTGTLGGGIRAWDSRLSLGPPYPPGQATASGAGPTFESAAKSIADNINFFLNINFRQIIEPPGAISSGNRLSLRSSGTEVTPYRTYSNASLSGSLLTAPKKSQVYVATLSGTIPGAPDSITLTIHNPSLTNGLVSKTHNFAPSDTLEAVAASLATAINSDTNLKRIGIFAEATSSVVYITSSAMDLSTFSQSGTSNSIRLEFGINCGGVRADFNAVNQLKHLSPGGKTKFQGSTGKAIASVAENQPLPSAYSHTLTGLIKISSATVSNTTYSTTTSSGSTTTLTRGPNNRGSTLVSISGTKTTGNILTIVVIDSRLTGGEKSISYTVQGNDTITSIASNIASTIDSDIALKNIGITASTKSLVDTDWSQEFTGNPDLAAGNNLVDVSINDPASTLRKNSYQISTLGTSFSQKSSSSFASIDIGTQNDGHLRASIIYGGSSATGTIISLYVHNPLFRTGPVTISHAISSGDSAASIATSLKNSINSNSTLANLGMSATSSAANLIITSAKMGHTTFDYDANGNLVSDGVKTYQWDAENRLVQISYPGTGNTTKFFYDGASRAATIQETYNGSETHITQTIWSDFARLEERSDSKRKLFFGRGELIDNNKYFYSKDQIDSVRETTTNASFDVNSFSYDPWGVRTDSNTSSEPSIQFAGYYKHLRSGLHLTLTRQYDAETGRWLNRDLLEEDISSNVYTYVENTPTSLRDPSGLYAFPLGLLAVDYVVAGAAGAAIGAGIGVSVPWPKPQGRKRPYFPRTRDFRPCCPYTDPRCCDSNRDLCKTLCGLYFPLTDAESINGWIKCINCCSKNVRSCNNVMKNGGSFIGTWEDCMKGGTTPIEGYSDR